MLAGGERESASLGLHDCGAPVAEVVRGLADGKGCAIVCEQRRVVGVFTSVDALRSPGKTGR